MNENLGTAVQQPAITTPDQAVAHYDAKTVGRGIYTTRLFELVNTPFVVASHKWPSSDKLESVAKVGELKVQFRGDASKLVEGATGMGTFLIAQSPKGSTGQYEVAAGSTKAYMVLPDA